MSTLKIVPERDWAVLKEYLKENSLVLIPEHALNALPEKKRTALTELAKNGGQVDYAFGGEPDIIIDTILSEEAYALCELLGQEDDDEEESDAHE